MSIKKFVSEHKVEIGIIGGTVVLSGLAFLVFKDLKALDSTTKFVKFVDEGIQGIATRGPVTLNDIKDIQAVSEAYLVCKDPEFWYIIDAKPEDFIEFAARWVG